MARMPTKTKQDNRSLTLAWVDAASLSENPHNWRTHPEKQLDGIRDAIREVGWAGALLYNKRTKRLIDGHARKKLFEGQGEVPVLIGSWTEDQEMKILATLDPLAALAGADSDALDKLLREIDTRLSGWPSKSRLGVPSGRV